MNEQEARDACEAILVRGLAEGWSREPVPLRHLYDGPGWRLWKRLEGVPDCRCNEKPPSVCLKPTWFRRPDGDGILDLCEVVVVGESPVGWVEAKVYSIPLDKVLEQLDTIVATVSAMWVAAFQGGAK